MRRPWLLTILAVVLVAGLGAASFAMLRTGDEAEQTAGSPPAETESKDSSAAESSPTDEDEESGSADPGESEREAIATEVARIMTTWDPQKDTTATEAEKRAAEYMTAERADEIVAPQRPTTGEHWLHAAEQEATSEPQVEILRGTEAGIIAVEARWTWTTDDGHVVSQSEQRRIYHFTFTEGEDPKISDYTWELRQD